MGEMDNCPAVRPADVGVNAAASCTVEPLPETVDVVVPTDAEVEPTPLLIEDALSVGKVSELAWMPTAMLEAMAFVELRELD